MSRPSLPPNQRRSEYVGVRLTRLELVRIYAIAKAVRMDVGEFIRFMALGTKKHEHPQA